MYEVYTVIYPQMALEFADDATVSIAGVSGC